MTWLNGVGITNQTKNEYLLARDKIVFKYSSSDEAKRSTMKRCVEKGFRETALERVSINRKAGNPCIPGKRKYIP